MNGQAIIDDMPGVLAPTFTNDNTAALQALIATGAADLILTPGVWICTQTLSLQPGQTLKGLGSGYNYDHRSKLVFKGTGSKNFNIPGAISPATIANPAAGNGYLGPVDKVDSQISRSVIQDCFLGGSFGSRRPDRYGMADHRGVVAHRTRQEVPTVAR